jgi:hypothetical protein
VSDEQRLSFVGHLRFSDPPKSDTKAALDDVNRRGVALVVGTDDCSTAADRSVSSWPRPWRWLRSPSPFRSCRSPRRSASSRLRPGLLPALVGVTVLYVTATELTKRMLSERARRATSVI